MHFETVEHFIKKTDFHIILKHCIGRIFGKKPSKHELQNSVIHKIHVSPLAIIARNAWLHPRGKAMG